MNLLISCIIGLACAWAGYNIGHWRGTGKAAEDRQWAREFLASVKHRPRHRVRRILGRKRFVRGKLQMWWNRMKQETKPRTPQEVARG